MATDWLDVARFADTALLMLSSGLSILTNSADRLLLTALLWYLLEVKATKEEEYLVGRYGSEYTDYQQKVPGKFFPSDLLDDMPSVDEVEEQIDGGVWKIAMENDKKKKASAKTPSKATPKKAAKDIPPPFEHSS